MTINLYFLIIHYIFKWAAQTQYFNQEQKYIYNKIDLKSVSINQDLYQCKVFVSIAKYLSVLSEAARLFSAAQTQNNYTKLYYLKCCLTNNLS